MAEELGTTKQTFITTIKSLVADGLLIEAGQRKSPNGYTIEYTINVAKLQALPLVACHQSRDLTGPAALPVKQLDRSEEHTSELKSLMRISYAVFCLIKKI